jgi:hypothetical protein
MHGFMNKRSENFDDAGYREFLDRVYRRMKFTSVKLIYFSPTGTTRKVIEAIAEWLSTNDYERKEPEIYL